MNLDSDKLMTFIIMVLFAVVTTAAAHMGHMWVFAAVFIVTIAAAFQYGRLVK